MRRWISRRTGVAAIVGLALAQGGQVPAAAECLYVDVYVTRQDATPIYPVGPGGCRASTGWKQRVSVPASYQTVYGLPPGAPNGYYLELRVPVPPDP